MNFFLEENLGTACAVSTMNSELFDTFNKENNKKLTEN